MNTSFKARLGTDLETMAALVAIGRMEEKGSDSIPALLTFVAGDCPQRASAATRALFALAPRAVLPSRWQENEHLNALSSAAFTLPSWMQKDLEQASDNTFFAGLCLVKMRELESIEARDRFIRRLAVFSGAWEEIAYFFAKEGFNKEAEVLCSAVKELAKLQYPLQISFSPTMQCQLHCPYCIAGADMPYPSEPDADEEQMEALLNGMETHGIIRLGLTGGEPTLFAGFPYFVEKFKARGFEYYLASNGLISQASLQTIAQKKPLCVTLHLTPEVLFSRQLSQYKETARRLLAENIYTIMRCNFPNPEDDPLIYLSIAGEVGLREIRIAIPMPNAKRGNRFVEMTRFTAYSPLLDTLVSQAEQRAMTIQISKPFPICCMTKRVARHFLRNGSLACVCPNHLQGFSNNIVVYPDLHFSACLGLNYRSSMPITAYKGAEDAASSFSGTLLHRMHTPISEQCRHCPLGLRGQCIGACLSYRPEVNNERPDLA